MIGGDVNGAFSWLLVTLSLVILVMAFVVGTYMIRRSAGMTRVDNAKLDMERREISVQLETLAAQRKDDEVARKAFFADLAAEREDLRTRWTVTEERLRDREDRLASEYRQVEEESASLKGLAAELEQQQLELEQNAQKLDQRLYEIAGLTPEMAKSIVLAKAESEAQAEAFQTARAIEAEATRNAETVARRILVTCLQRIASDQTAESVVSTVPLPSEDMKGRIIGREGRNIRAFEQVTGVNVLVDDTPETVVLSSFDPVRREVARLTLNELVADGRIHPARIEEVYQRAVSAIEELCWRAAEDACAEVGITDLHPDLMAKLGSLKYRTSYGQNVLAHLVESAHICGLLAAELGLNEQHCRRAAFLHDIGKAITHEQGGSHAANGAELAQKYGEHPDIIHAIAAHHGEIEPTTIEAVLVQAADAISGGRPGARRETLEAYVRRLERLEEIASADPGVDRVFAMQAGREIRVMVSPNEVDDNHAHKLAKSIAAQIEDELTYPGTIRVTVVRESRAMEVAK